MKKNRNRHCEKAARPTKQSIFSFSGSPRTLCVLAMTGGNSRNGERGSALVYILIAIALLALLTISFMQPSSQQTQSQNTFKLVSELQSQIELVRSAVQECAIAHYKGDATIDNSGAGTDPGADRRYPIKPNSAHFAAATVGPTAGRFVRDIRCPGDPGDDDDQVIIFNASSGKFMPPPPDLFNDWQWYNGDDGVFFWTSTDKSDAFIQTALDKLEQGFATCEADQIDATAAVKNLDSAPSVTCGAGDLCFRVWMRMNAASAVFPDEAGCP